MDFMFRWICFDDFDDYISIVLILNVGKMWLKQNKISLEIVSRDETTCGCELRSFFGVSREAKTKVMTGYQ
jgi:hypothetical protein